LNTGVPFTLKYRSVYKTCETIFKDEPLQTRIRVTRGFSIQCFFFTYIQCVSWTVDSCKRNNNVRLSNACVTHPVHIQLYGLHFSMCNPDNIINVDSIIYVYIYIKACIAVPIYSFFIRARFKNFNLLLPGWTINVRVEKNWPYRIVTKAIMLFSGIVNCHGRQSKNAAPVCGAFMFDTCYKLDRQGGETRFSWRFVSIGLSRGLSASIWTAIGWVEVCVYGV